MRTRSVSAFFLLSLALVACSQGSSGVIPAGPGDKITFTGDQKADWAQIVALEDQAKALVKTDGCGSAGDCRTAPVGSRACGGPRYYLAYCSRTTDSAALFQKLDVVANAERAYNEHYQIASTCEFRMPPTVALSGGSCKAQ
ncbi:MAG: hypothetical protein QOH22_2169 [Gemmatimonadaceae bacterium]|jgi:hypothetical protein|nr:hypothetical protein [Gemmatimonadaceae bacterium]